MRRCQRLKWRVYLMADTAKDLRYYGSLSASNKKKLEMWYSETIESIAENGGGQVGSASSNGASFSMRPDGMTNADWASYLRQALQMIENGIKYTGVSFGCVN